MIICTLDGARGIPAPVTTDWSGFCAWLDHCATTEPTCDKVDLAAFVPAKLADERDDRGRLVRRETNTVAVTLACLDIDRGDPAHVAQTLAMLDAAGMAYAAYETPSSALAFARGETAVRLVLPLAEPIPAQQWRDVRRSLIAALGWREGTGKALDAVDVSTSDPSRLFYLPCRWTPDAETLSKAERLGPLPDGDRRSLARVVKRDGRPVDWRALPAPPPIAKLARELDTVVIDAGSRHDALFRAAASARGRGLPVAPIITAMAARCAPPLDAAEVEALIADVCARYPEGHALTDVGNAELLAAQHRGALAYCDALGGWLTYDGRLWEPDEHAATRAAIATVRTLNVDAARCDNPEAEKRLRAFARECEANKRINAMIAIGKSQLAIDAARFDADPNAFVCRNAVIDLATFTAREHRAADLSTVASDVAYDPAAVAPTFDAFLARIVPDAETRAFLARYAGYCLTADTSAQAFVFLVGDGANGKSTYVNALRRVLGSYATMTPPRFLIRGQSTHPNDLMTLRGKRAAFGSELPRDAEWDAERIKMLTGGEALKARHLYREFVEFVPHAKLIASANYRPTAGDDAALWRRMLCVDFGVVIPEAERDPYLDARLALESSGVLNWMLRGLSEFRRIGLAPPAAVRHAGASYRADEDTLSAWLEESTMPGDHDLASAVRESYISHCRRAETKPITPLELGRALTRKGFADGRANDGTRLRFGLKIRTGLR